jgi:hypothetical protein
MTIKNKFKLSRREEKTIFDTGCQLWFSSCAVTDNLHFARFFYNGERPPEPQDYEAKLFEFKEKDLIYEIGSEVIPSDNGKFLEFSPIFFIDKLFIKYFNDSIKAGFKYFWLKSFLGESSEQKIGIIAEGKLAGVLLLNRK